MQQRVNADTTRGCRRSHAEARSHRLAPGSIERPPPDRRHLRINMGAYPTHLDRSEGGGKEAASRLFPGQALWFPVLKRIIPGLPNPETDCKRLIENGYLGRFGGEARILPGFFRETGNSVASLTWQSDGVDCRNVALHH